MERNCDREIVRNIKEKKKKKQQQEETEKRLHNSSDKNFFLIMVNCTIKKTKKKSLKCVLFKVCILID